MYQIGKKKEVRNEKVSKSLSTQQCLNLINKQICTESQQMPNKKTNTKQKTYKLIKPRKQKKIQSKKEAHSKSCLGLVKEIKYFGIISKLQLILYFIYTHTYI